MGLYTAKEIKEITAKAHPGPWYAKKVIREISPYVTWLFLRTPITPNQTTILMIVVGTIASILFAFGGSLITLIGALVLQLFYVLDHVDGEVARCKDMQSVTGIYLDSLANFIVNPLVFVGITIGVYQYFPSLAVLILGLVASWSLVLRDLAGSTVSIALHQSLDKLPANQGMNSKVMRGKSEGITSIRDNTKPAVPPFTPSVLFNLVKKALFLWNYPAIMNVITVAAILNAFFPRLQVGLFGFNFMYLVIILYGITLPIVCALVISYQVAIKNPDRLFREITGANK